MSGKRVLLLGGGGREHAMAWKLSQSSLLDELFISPGNPGTANHGINIELNNSDFSLIQQFVEQENIDLIVVGPEQPLVDGIADYFADKNIAVFGPSKIAAQLEGSKEFAKDFMEANNIPTADFKTFKADNFDAASEYTKSKGSYPVVLKADGLAGGKGVFICKDQEETDARLDQLKTDQKLKEAASTLVVEEFMEGEEASVFVISDGENYKILHNAQDHKRIGEGDTGLNTGGMGAYSPAPIMSDEMLKRVDREIIKPTIDGMRKNGHPYKGVLYVGLMITEHGPKVVEYNCRFGDPECQVILPPLKNDLLDLILSCVNGDIESKDIELDNNYYCCVVMASEGYPTNYEKGKVISGIDSIDSDSIAFHAGTKLEHDALITSGGRVLSIVGKGDSLQTAIDHAYKNVEKVTFSNNYFRSDIGKKGLEKLS